jgi:hypothetical protein
MTGISYYGVRYAKECHPSDLFVTYFTSSTNVANYIKEHGLPDIIEIRKIFNDINIAREWEGRVLKRLKVTVNPNWINKHDLKSFEPMYGDDNPMKDPNTYKKWLSIVTSTEHKEKLKNTWSKLEVREKTSGKNHYSNREGWTSSILGDNNPMKSQEVVAKAMANRQSFKGLNNPRVKLSLDDVTMIKNKKEWLRGDVSRIARELKVSRTAINLIRFGKNWQE